MNTIAKAAVRWYESKGIRAYVDAEGRVYVVVRGDDELHIEVSPHEVILRATATLTNP